MASSPKNGSAALLRFDTKSGRLSQEEVTGLTCGAFADFGSNRTTEAE
jgi:hypothetical protein